MMPRPAAPPRCRWIQIESVEEGVEAICTVGSFFAANEGLAFAREEAEALRPGEGFGLGGGAAPEYMVEALTEERAKALDEIERLLHGAIEVQVDDGSDPDSGALPYSIWFDDQIIGADTTLDRTIEDALETARRWDGERQANAQVRAADAIMSWEKRSNS